MLHPLERWRQEENARREQRQEKPLRRYELAERIDCAASRLTQIVRHGERPSMRLLQRIKDETGISADEILEAAATGKVTTE